VDYLKLVEDAKRHYVMRSRNGFLFFEEHPPVFFLSAQAAIVWFAVFSAMPIADRLKAAFVVFLSWLMSYSFWVFVQTREEDEPGVLCWLVFSYRRWCFERSVMRGDEVSTSVVVKEYFAYRIETAREQLLSEDGVYQRRRLEVEVAQKRRLDLVEKMETRDEYSSDRSLQDHCLRLRESAGRSLDVLDRLDDLSVKTAEYLDRCSVFFARVVAQIEILEMLQEAQVLLGKDAAFLERIPRALGDTVSSMLLQMDGFQRGVHSSFAETAIDIAVATTEFSDPDKVSVELERALAEVGREDAAVSGGLERARGALTSHFE